MGWQSFVAAGKKDEAFVAWLLVNEKGGLVAKATPEEDINDHIDLWWTTPKGVKVGVDVKGMRKRNRYDNTPDNDITRLEFRNVNGRSGWLYGHATYIAFRRLGCVAIVNREKLLDYARRKVAGKIIHQQRPSVCWELYTRARWNRFDITCMAPLDEIEAMSDFVITIPKGIPPELS